MSDAGRESWTIQRILTWTQEHFIHNGIQSARLDAEVLLAATLGVNRVHLYTHFDQPLTEAERSRYRDLVTRRSAREPVAHILGHREFYSRDFEVTREVLVPRPETEHLVDAVLEWVREQGIEEPSIADIGTGSGCIAVTLACELAGARLVATDISEAVTDVARRNALAHGVGERVELVTGDLYEALDQPTRRRFDVVVCNPPYLDAAVRELLQPEVRDWEPAEALFAEESGLAVLSRLCAEAYAHVAAPGLFACEIGYDQKPAVVGMLEDAGEWMRLEVLTDLQGHPRIVVARRGPTGAC